MSNILDIINNWLYNTSGQKELDIKKQQSRNAINFVIDYYNSPGFRERFKNVPHYVRNYYADSRYRKFPDNIPEDYTYGAKLDPFTLITHYNSPEEGSYTKNNEVYIDNTEYTPDYPTFDYSGTAAHEVAHAFHNNIKLTKKYKYTHTPYFLTNEYANIFPHFRDSQSYLRVLYHLDDKKLRELYEQHPEVVYNVSSITHDALPEESYADLMAFREALNRFNIYDSRKANNLFTKEHLNKWKKLNKHLRLFDNFTDEQIILMMNDVAQNNLNSSEQLLYAKSGTKLNPIEKFRKGRKVKIILPNGRTAEEREIGNFIKLKGENFWRRVNSNGTLTRVGINSGEYQVSKAAPRVKSETMYQINKDRKSKGLQEIDYNGDLRTTHYPSALDNFWYGTLSRTEGSNNFWSSLGSVLGAGFTGTNGNWYDGKYHVPRKFKNPETNLRHGGNEITNYKRDDYLNYVRAFTLKDYTGFKPSDKIGRGRYANIKQYSNLPYVLGKFYGDTAYISPKYRQIIETNLGKTYRVDKDSLSVGSRNYENTYDARNHYVSFTGTKGKPTLRFEDVFNTNNDFVDKNNYPMIVNLEIPIIYTNDEDKLNLWPTLTKWLLMPSTFETKTKD